MHDKIVIKSKFDLELILFLKRRPQKEVPLHKLELM